MLVHILELSVNSEYNDWDYEHTKFLKAYKIKSYDKFIRFIQSLKKYHKEIIIDDNWYSVEDYALNFPTDNDHVPCIYVYVSEL